MRALTLRSSQMSTSTDTLMKPMMAPNTNSISTNCMVRTFSKPLGSGSIPKRSRRRPSIDMRSPIDFGENEIQAGADRDQISDERSFQQKRQNAEIGERRRAELAA